jgi:hypothetical protein
MTSDSCLAWAEAGRGLAERYLVICQKTKGHTDSPDPKQREHFDPDKEIRWNDEEA